MTVSGLGFGLRWSLRLIVPFYVCLGWHLFEPSGVGYCQLYPIRRATLHAPGEASPCSLGGLAGGVRELPARMREIDTTLVSPDVRNLDKGAVAIAVAVIDGRS